MRRGALFLVAGFVACTGGPCGKTEEQKTVTIETFPHAASPPVDPSAALTAPTETSTARVLPYQTNTASEFDGNPNTTFVFTTIIEAAAPSADPDFAVVQAGRAAGGQCFAGVSGGPDARHATISVTVVATGRVTRTEVQVDGPEPELADCLHRVGDSLSFSDKSAADASTGGDIRSFSIDISVARPH